MTKEEAKVYHQKYYQEHREKMLSQQMSPEEKKIYNRDYYQAHHEQELARQRAYYATHKEQQNASSVGARKARKEARLPDDTPLVDEQPIVRVRRIKKTPIIRVTPIAEPVAMEPQIVPVDKAEAILSQRGWQTIDGRLCYVGFEE
jgi:hypothetical protein